jgi:hypothetical protein
LQEPGQLDRIVPGVQGLKNAVAVRVSRMIAQVPRNPSRTDLPRMRAAKIFAA